MVPFRASALISVGTLACLAHWAIAQRPPPPPPPSIIRPVPGPNGRPLGPNERPAPPGKGEPEVDDVRPWIEGGLVPRPKSKDIDPELLKKLMKDLPKDQANKQQIEEFLKQHPEFLKDPDFLKQLDQMSKSPDFPQNVEGKLPPEDRPPIGNKEAFEENLKNVIEAGQKPPMWPEGGPKINPPDPTSTPNVSDPTKLPEASQANYADNEWVKWMQKNFGESEAGKSAIKDLMSALEKKDTKGMFDNIPEFKNGGWKDFDKWGKSNAGDLWKIKPPEMGGTKITPPKMGGDGSGGGSSIGGGGGGSGGGSSIGGGGLGGGGSALFAIIAGIAGAIFLIALFVRKWKLKQAENASAAHPFRNGVDFDSIRTREQLVHAFDHVSLDQMGEDARTWNHRVIADQFAETRPAHAEPAEQVAALYERARYAPLDEDLSAGEFSDARRDLRVIAGVAS